MKVMVERISRLLMENELKTEEEEIIQYGIFALIGNCISIIIAIGIGTHFKETICAIIAWILMFPLRKYAGGFHSKTTIGCLLTSFIMMFADFAICSKIISDDGIKIIFILIITAFIIIKYAPVDNCSKRLDADEIKQYRKKSIHFTIMDVTIGIIALALKCETLIRAVLVSTLYVSSSLIIGLISDFYRDKSGYMH